ncbi:hypothetical protein [Hufsiella ginkgonis]|uniref:Uncharacterized protein n=1 Tax=Hufsiella ginkgonis TaxID=2695274 RepID=A0A7K1XX15_9SPHI|nr:hypothetical protein [Hufsiella ginkgonis]MXV15348.1 hypothetical protein [Hufsiella ginkgonis]
MISCDTINEDPEKQEQLLAGLKEALQDKQESTDGFVYAFQGTDDMIRRLTTFILYQRTNLPYFKFELTIKDAGTHVYLKITGGEGAKDVEREMQL